MRPFFVLLTLCFSLPVLAGTPIGSEKTDTILMSADPLDSSDIFRLAEIELSLSELDQNLNNMMNLWYVQDSTSTDSALTEIPSVDVETFVPQFEDSVYIARIAALCSPIQLTYNNVVRNLIDRYTLRIRDKLEVMLGLSEYYFPMIEEILDEYGLPLELKYVAVIESALNPRVVSRAGATGMWQFMLGTARLNKLEVTTFVDERRDPVKSTRAGAMYLKDLYKIYGNWHLAIAAYNCGPGNVNKAIRRAGGGIKDFWEIYPYLPKETRAYVPAYIAAMYSMTYYKEHNLTPAYINIPPVSDSIMINQDLNLLQVSEVMNIPIEELRSINPQYRRDIIPGSSKLYPLRVPTQMATQFIALSDSIFNYKKDEYLSHAYRSRTPAGVTKSVTNIAGKEKINHRIGTGETLGVIAQKYKVRVSDLQAWNGLSGTRIRAGRTLAVYVQPSGKAAALKTAASSTEKVEPLKEGEYLIYQVRSGDSVWKIARDYGVSEDEVLQWNNLGRSTKLSVGQRLKIKKG
jgi:membrane-bound lytic murein transglycosylase D